MRKIKMVIASFLGGIAVVMAFAVGGKAVAASTQPYVNADFSAITRSDGNTDVTKSFKTAESFTINGFTFSTTASTSNMQVDSKGIKWQNNDCSMTFTTTDVAKLTLGLYVDGTDRSMSVSNDNNLSITGLQKNSTGSDTVTYDTDKTYTYSVTSSTKYLTITINNCPASTFTIAYAVAKSSVYVQTIKIQPYATVTYVMNGGTAISPKTTLYGDKYTPETPADRDGYSFDGWYTNEGLTDEYDGDSIVSDDLTLYAKWVASHTVTFNSMGGSAVSSQAVESGNKATKPTPNPTKTGYAFVDWYTSPDGGTTLSATAFDFANTNINEDITLYAKWEVAATYTVRFKKYSDDVEVYDIVSDITEGESIGAEDWPKDPKILNKTFNGWYDGETKYTSSTEITANKTLVAKFTDLDNDLIKFKDYYSGLPTSNADPHIASYNITDDSKVQVQEINKRNTGSPTFDDGTTFGGFIQCQKVVFTLDEAALVSIYALQTGDKKSRTTKLYKGEEEIESFVFGYSTKTTIKYFLGAGTYTVSIYENSDGSGTLANYYGIRVNKDYLAKDTTATLYKQFDDDDNPAKLRFIGKIEGIAYANYESISSVVIEFDFNDEHKSANCYHLYKSVATLNNLFEADPSGETMYVVLTINNVSAYVGKDKSFTNIRMTITFSDGSTKVVGRNDIDLA